MSSPPYQYQSSQYLSPVNCFDFDDEFKPLFGSHDYALGQGSGDPSVSVQDDSSVKEVTHVKKKTNKRRQKSKSTAKKRINTMDPRGRVNVVQCLDKH
ncbi:hypothetical protein Tco_0918442, partial [Tanacetum coccineum]